MSPLIFRWDQGGLVPKRKQRTVSPTTFRTEFTSYTTKGTQGQLFTQVLQSALRTKFFAEAIAPVKTTQIWSRPCMVQYTFFHKCQYPTCLQTYYQFFSRPYIPRGGVRYGVVLFATFFISLIVTLLPLFRELKGSFSSFSNVKTPSPKTLPYLGTKQIVPISDTTTSSLGLTDNHASIGLKNSQAKPIG